VAKVQKPLEVPAGVELTVRKTTAKEWIFLLNHTANTQTISISKAFTDLVTGESQTGKVKMIPYGVRVLQAT
jgi:beta-galactosidase